MKRKLKKKMKNTIEDFLKGVTENDFITDIEICMEERSENENHYGIGGANSNIIKNTTYSYYSSLNYKEYGVLKKYTIEQDLIIYGNNVIEEHLLIFQEYLNTIILHEKLSKNLQNKEVKKSHKI